MSSRSKTPSPHPHLRASTTCPSISRALPRSRALAFLVAACLARASLAAAAPAPEPAPVPWRVTLLGSFFPSGIDDAGRVVGQTGPNNWTPATWDAGTTRPLPIGKAELGIVEATSAGGRSVGWLRMTDGTYRAVRWTDGRRELLATPPGRSAMALGIGPNGIAFGQSEGSDGAWHATTWVARLPVRLPWLPGADGAAATAGNGSGLVVGHCHVPAQGFWDAQATAWIGGRPQALQGVGGESGATGVNEAGVIIGFGYVSDNNHSRALVWPHAGAAPRVLEDLGGHSSFALGINASGTVVGRSFTIDSQVVMHGVMWIGTRIVDLGSLLPPGMVAQGWYVDDATAINDAGVIAGRVCRDVPYQCQGMVMSPP